MHNYTEQVQFFMNELSDSICPCLRKILDKRSHLTFTPAGRARGVFIYKFITICVIS